MSPDKKITVIGQGYVGLPMALELAKFFDVVGYDNDHKKITKLRHRKDVIDNDQFNAIIYNSSLAFESNLNSKRQSDIYIVTVPTQITTENTPDLTALINASTEIGKELKKNDLVIFESTVYPGATEEICVPILEEQSGLIFNKDFYCGYSPERIFVENQP